MYLFRYFYLLFTCLHASTSHLLRQKRARSAVFHKVFQYKNTKLNIAPIETIPDVLLEEDCCNHCLAKNGCVSVNYERSGLKRCELLAEDRDARNETDFVNEGYFSYYDTIVRDLCNEKDSCYPCSCWSAEFYRSPCICRKLHGKMRQHSPSWISYITINIYHHRVYGIDQQNGIVVTPGALPTNDSYSIQTTPWVREIKYRRDGLVCGIGADNSVYVWTGSSWKDNYVYGLSFDCAAKHILTIDLSTFELHLKEDSKASTKVATGAISRIQEYGKYWYAIGKDCKCIMRHGTTPSPTVNKWEILTTNPGSSVEFKVAFNDIIYSLHEDQKIYEWYGNENRWIMIYQGPCIHFDVYHLIFCVTSDHKIKSNYGEYVPRPNIHIPFKTVNHVNKTTPYGRGMDMDGNTTVALDLEANNIALDQFGKGYVLQKGDGENVEFGNFEDTILRGPFRNNHVNHPAYFTISLWFRATWQATHQRTAIISSLSQNGMAVQLQGVDDFNANLLIIVSGTSDYAKVVVSKQKEFFYSWTHVVVKWNYLTRCLRVYLQGILEKTYCGRVSTSKTSTPSALRSRTPAVYISDIAIWYALLLDEQILQLYQSDIVAPGWRKKFNFTSVTESSCEQLRRQRPYITSGYYWIKLNGKMISVYCDMVTDGGGWTQITHLDTSLQAHEISDATKIGDVFFKNFVLTHDGLSMLRQLVDFKQLRIRCSKPAHHDRIVDIATTTSSVLDYFTGVTDEKPYACGGYYPLEEDNSVLAQRCAQWNDGKFGHRVRFGVNERFKYYILDIFNIATVNWPDSQCDDISSDGLAIYQYYVR